ncbi:hypothetical protein ACFQ9J_33765 [Streptomyces sp. NPDC056529]|uniref:hypothetical protein n=1 Tax=Streptomyces sp. NPDC056529 TaxID=3345855 RepID=UPI0036B832A5
MTSEPGPWRDRPARGGRHGRAVPADGARPGVRDDLDDDALLGRTAAGPPPAERRDGLTTLVQGLGGYTVAGTGARVTVRLEDPCTGNGRDQATGQLVCTLARAQSVLEPAVRPEDVEVVLRPPEGPAAGPYRCADFLAG